MNRSMVDPFYMYMIRGANTVIKGVLGTSFWGVVLSMKAKFPGGATETQMGCLN